VQKKGKKEKNGKRLEKGYEVARVEKGKSRSEAMHKKGVFRSNKCKPLFSSQLRNYCFRLFH